MRVAALSSVVVLAIGVSACGGEGGDGPIGAAAQAEIDPGGKDYLIYTLTDDAGSQLGQVLVTATTGDGYSANTEYWYVTSNLSNTSAVTVTGGSSEYWTTAPSGLGTLSFTMARTPTWTSGTSSGIKLVYSNAFTGEYDGIDWGMSDSGGTWTGQITWWSNSTGNLFGDSVVRRLVPTRTSGTHEYYVSSPL